MYVVHGMIDYTRKIISRNVWTVKIFWKVWWIFFQVWNRADIEEPNKLSVYDNSNITVSAMAEEQKKIRGKISDCELLKLYSKWPELYRKEMWFYQEEEIVASSSLECTVSSFWTDICSKFKIQKDEEFS